MLAGSLFSGMTHATPTYLSTVNNYCSSSYSCSECHISPPALNSTGRTFAQSGHDPASICPPAASPTCTDSDGDGYAVEGDNCGPIDCNDKQAAVNPGAVENCTNGKDDNCNGLIDTQDPTAVGCPITATCTDADGDGYAFEGGACGPTDCDDSNLAVNPGAVESCTNGTDDNCNGLVDCADPSCSSTRSCKPARKKNRHHHEGDAYSSNENGAGQESDGDND
jgi:hypothetical protein